MKLGSFYTVISMAVIFIVTSCASSPPLVLRVNPNLSLEENKSAIRQCIASAEKKYPRKLDYYNSDPRITPIRTSCYSSGSYASCTSSGGYEPSHAVEYDENATNAYQYFDRCMASKGFSEVSVPHCWSTDKKGTICLNQMKTANTAVYYGNTYSDGARRVYEKYYNYDFDLYEE
jgi:hypothetical protein